MHLYDRGIYRKSINSIKPQKLEKGMRGKNTIIINGKAYDAVTGQPAKAEPIALQAEVTDVSNLSEKNVQSSFGKKVINDFGPTATRRTTPVRTKPMLKKATPKVERKTHAATVMHRTPDRSRTLHRQATKRPEAYTAPLSVEQNTHARSPMISKFAPHPVTSKPKQSIQPAKMAEYKPSASAVAPVQQKKELQKTDSRSLKEQLIKERLEEAGKNKEQAPRGIQRFIAKKPRAMHVATMCLALMMLGGYLTYINMPNLSVRVASARSGVEANFPEYRPDGYHFSGPVAYSPGEVILKFKSNTSDQGYIVKQRASNWDSQAVLDNFVSQESNSYLTYSERGLTIYTYSNKAAWVNGGVLYTIDGDAPLSSEQVLRIAGSL